MPNISSIGAGIYTSLAFIDLDVQDGAGDATHVGRGDDVATYVGLFETRSSTSGLNPGDSVPWTVGTDAKAFGRIREFPNLGIPANVVNVPQYGQGASSQIAGQSDAPSLDFTFNYVPEEHKFISLLREGGENRLFRIRLSNAQQVEDTAGVILPYETVQGSGSDMREFSDFFLFGSVASFEIVPNLTDSNQLNVTLTIDGEMRGPSSYTPDSVLANAPVYA